MGHGNKPKAVVLGMSGNGLGITRSLGRRGVEVIAVVENFKSANMYSRYISEKWIFDGSEDGLVDELLNKASRFDVPPVLFPIRDATVIAISNRLEEVKKCYRLVMSDGEIIRRSLCKTSFSHMAADFNLPVPKSISIKNHDELVELAKELQFPVILKPEYRNDEYVSSVSGKAFIANSLEELLEHYVRFSNFQSDAIVQEYIPGTDKDLFFCFLYYSENSALVLSISGRKIRQYPPMCGSTSSCEVVNAPEIVKIADDFFSRIKYTGPCSMEFKRDSRDGSFYLIEPTVGRLDWNNSFAEGNGMPIPYINYLDALDLPLPRIKQNRIAKKWLRWSSDFESAKYYRKHGQLSFWGWLKSISPPFIGAVWASDDPYPFLKIYIGKFVNRASKILGPFRRETQ